jgi:mannitol-1-/sugar-/sorbitol-6-phosphatase
MASGLHVTAAGVLFDMDGTLVDSTAVVETVWAEFAAQYDVDLAELLQYSHGRQTLASVRRFLPNGHDPLTVTKALEAKELARLDGVVEIAGATQLLATLRDELVAMVTSAPRALAEARMRAAGLALPRVIIAAEDVTTGKPSPEGYLTAAHLLGLRAQDCVVFEDAEAGLRAGVASGACTVVVGADASAATTGLNRIPDFQAVAALIDRETRCITLTTSLQRDRLAVNGCRL